MTTTHETTPATSRETREAKTELWAEAFRIGMAIAEGASMLDGADRVQVLDVDGNVLFTGRIEGGRR